ncbi:glycoside hydrolase family 18 protein [Hypoxylon trugodes]|uniref:glycoside hydrolase family 18 protein n=1 Tax=Hypoxylon trugodes TaxID=326681 RepID=UPI002194ECA4|nr:glycoside hydrolase family 18 protein [Hypoxylon trugodes]KAI1384872.1 glycoside hydrolase family 18 protein [Hypoxylon trugodes]
MLFRKAASWLTRLLPLLAPTVSAAEAAANDHRVVIYYQTFNYNGSATDHVSLLPLVNNGAASVTHVLIAAIHIQDDDGGIHLNNLKPSDPEFDQVWSDAAQLQAAGVTVMGMLGGAAAGSYAKLDGDDASFEKYYAPLHDMIGTYNLQGLDLDVEENFSLNGVIRLIDRLKKDFGDGFIISLAPVASALTKGGGNLSGFSYFDLESQRGSSIGFYNAQFYYGWGDASSASDYEAIVDDGFPANKVVLGLVTDPSNGSGFVALDSEAGVLSELISENSGFGGVAGWEYFNSQPGGDASPWEWASWMADHLKAAAAAGKREVPRSEAVWRGIRKAGRNVRGQVKKVYRDYIA